MPKQVKAWYDKKWLLPALAILTFVSGPFREDIRDAALKAVDIVLGDWLFDVLLAGALIGLVVVLMLKSDRAARASEDLRQKLHQDLADHRRLLQKDLANHRKELQQHVATLVDSKLNPITEGIGTLKSNVSALDSRLAALDSRMTALDSRMSTLESKMTALDSRMSALGSKMTALESGMIAVKDKSGGSNEKP